MIENKCSLLQQDKFFVAENGKERAILKLKKVFKMGYYPRRGYNDYLSYVNECPTSFLVNCFAHACFNLTDKMLQYFNFGPIETECYTINTKIIPENYSKIDQHFTEILNNVGLQVDQCNLRTKIENKSQWKVALYFSDIEQDFHFLLQEKDNRWSSKQGWLENVSIYNNLPNIYNETYKLFDIKKITNPNAKAL